MLKAGGCLGRSSHPASPAPAGPRVWPPSAVKALRPGPSLRPWLSAPRPAQRPPLTPWAARSGLLLGHRGLGPGQTGLSCSGFQPIQNQTPGLALPAGPSLLGLRRDFQATQSESRVSWGHSEDRFSSGIHSLPTRSFYASALAQTRGWNRGWFWCWFFI